MRVETYVKSDSGATSELEGVLWYINSMSLHMARIDQTVNCTSTNCHCPVLSVRGEAGGRSASAADPSVGDKPGGCGSALTLKIAESRALVSTSKYVVSRYSSSPSPFRLGVKHDAADSPGPADGNSAETDSTYLPDTTLRHIHPLAGPESVRYQ